MSPDLTDWLEPEDRADRAARVIERTRVECDADDVVRFIGGHIAEVPVVRSDTERRAHIAIDAKADAVAKAVVLDRVYSVDLEAAANPSESGGPVRLNTRPPLTAD